MIAFIICISFITLAVLVVAGIKREKNKIDPTSKTSFDLTIYKSDEKAQKRALYFFLLSWVLKKNRNHEQKKRLFTISYLSEKFQEKVELTKKDFDFFYAKSVHSRTLARWMANTILIPKERGELMQICLTMANIANDLTDREYITFLRFGEWIGVGKSYIDEVLRKLVHEQIDLKNVHFDSLVNPMFKKHKAYSLLDLEFGSSFKLIKEKYRKLAKTTHPDQFPDVGEDEKKQLEKQFSELKKAYEYLSSENS